MHLLNHDFDDLYALIVYFRSRDTKIPQYIKALEQIILYIDAPIVNKVIEFNTVRKILRAHVKTNDEVLSWIAVDNEYTAHTFIIKKEIYYRVLVAIFKEMIVSQQDNQRLWMLCDSVHNIPLLLVDLKKPKRAIKTMIKCYQKEYNKKFLIKELKGL